MVRIFGASFAISFETQYEIYFKILFLHILVDQSKGVQEIKPCYENQVYLVHYAKHKTLTHQEA
jgi:hypothetical protein